MHQPDSSLYAHHRRYVEAMLLRFGVRRAEIDDALQDVFERVHRLLGSFEGRAKLETWIFAICRRVAAEHRRAGARARRGVPGDVTNEVASDPGSREVHALLGKLEPEDRDLLVLHEVGELSISALSELSGSARTTVRRRLARARLSVADHLDANQLDAGGICATSADVAHHRFDVDELALAALARDADDHEFLSSEYAFSRCGDVILVIWHGTPDLRGHAILTKIVRAAVAQTTCGIGCVVVVDAESSLPDAKAREISSWLVASYAHHVHALAWVARGDAKWQATPPLGNSMVFASGRSPNTRFFTTVSAALDWVAQSTPVSDASVLCDHYASIRRRMLAPS